jgi:RNA polymerase sigma-70 factor (ECF subfamily)
MLDGRRLAPHLREPLRPGAALGIGPWILRLREGASDAPVQVAPPQREEAQALATRPTIFIRLRAQDSRERELSWQTFRNRYAPVILGFARHAGLSADAAEDVLQDVLLAFFRVSPKFEYDPAKGRFRGYLKRATMNVIRRRHRRAAPQALAHDPEDADAEDPHLALRWEEAWEAQLVERALEEVRSHVDPRTWEAFDLYVRRDMPVGEVSRRVGLAINSVHQAKSRVLRSAREVADRLRAEEG